jgi:hypothetical protein
MPAMFENHAVDAWPQLGQGLLLAGEIHGPGRGQDGNLHPGIGPFGGRHGRKARVVEGGRAGVGFQVPPQGAMGFQGTDAAAQPAVPGESDEDRAGGIKPAWAGEAGRRRSLSQFPGDGVARQGHQQPAAI